MWFRCPRHLVLGSEGATRRGSTLTSHRLLDVIKHQIHELVVTLQGPHNYTQSARAAEDSRNHLTLSTAVEFDLDFLVHVFGQVQNIFFFGLFLLCVGLGAATTGAGTIVSTPSASRGTTAAASEMSSFRHGCWSQFQGDEAALL